MQITEAFDLTVWIKKNIEDAPVIPRFDDLFNILNTNVRRGNNQAAQPFVDQLTVLTNTISSININDLSLAQLQLLDLMKISQNIGRAGKEKLETIIKGTLDIANVTNQVNEMKSQIASGIAMAQQLNVGLAPFVKQDAVEIANDRVLTRVIFQHDAAVENVKDLREWADRWFDIGRGFAIANGQTPEDVQVIGGSRGSLVLELALLATTAVPIAKAINLILDSMVKYQDFRLRAEEVKKLKEANPTMAKDFDEDAKRWDQRAEKLKEEISVDVSNKIVESFSNYKKENKAELDKAVRTLVNFMAKGGDVDCVMPKLTDEATNDDQQTKEVKSLQQEFARIRSMKQGLLLEHKRNLKQDD